VGKIKDISLIENAKVNFNGHSNWYFYRIYYFFVTEKQNCQYCGKSYAHKTRNIIKFILIDNVCQILSWIGKKGSIAIKASIILPLQTLF